MQVNDVKELKALLDENQRLKKLLTERDLEVVVMKEINAKKWQPRELGAQWRYWLVSVGYQRDVPVIYARHPDRLFDINPRLNVATAGWQQQSGLLQKHILHGATGSLLVR